MLTFCSPRQAIATSLFTGETCCVQCHYQCFFLFPSPRLFFDTGPHWGTVLFGFRIVEPQNNSRDYVLPVYVLFTWRWPSRIKNLWRCNQRKQIWEPLKGHRNPLCSHQSTLVAFRQQKLGCSLLYTVINHSPKQPFVCVIETQIKTDKIHQPCGLSQSIVALGANKWLKQR